MFANSHKKGMIYGDVIFKNLSEAKKRAAEIGRENVINGTIGALLDGNGILVTFPSVDRLIADLDMKRASAYSPQQGFPDFLETIQYFCFQEYFPKTAVSAVAVAGGMGGIRHAIINYTEIGDSIIVPDWYWGPYKGIAEDNYRKITTFPLFRNNKIFNLEGFKEKIEQVGKKQKNIFILLDSPANNPTGYSLDLDEWDDVIAYLNTVDSPIIFFLDVAYMDFAHEKNKLVFQKIDQLQDHVFTIIDYTISKSLSKYGFRTAALIGIHEDKKVREEFQNIIAISNRGTHGSVNSLGQLLTIELYKNKEALASYYQEFHNWKTILRRRAEAFMNHIDKDVATPYRDGFFVSIQCENPEEEVANLKKENIFLIPLPKGIRVAICSIREDQLPLAANGINRVIKKAPKVSF